MKNVLIGVMKNTLLGAWAVIFLPAALIGAVCASLKVAYKFGHLMTTTIMKEILK